MPSLPPILRWDAVADPLAAVHVLHGMSEHAGRYAGLAQALNAAGFVVWAHDHRGHGRNPTSPVGLGHFADQDGWRLVVDDAWRVSAALRDAYPGRPLVLVAHSMGSFIAQTLLPEHGADYRAVVLVGTGGPPGVAEQAGRAVARVQRAALGARAPGTWLVALVFGPYNRQFAPTRTPLDWLSRDEREVDAYLADPLCGVPLTAQSWCDFLDGRGALATKDQLARIPKDLPIRLLAGERDPVGGNGRGPQRLVEAYRAAGLGEVSLRLYPGARHEIFNETNRAEVFAELVAWLTGVCAPRA
jgi:alpha-beta hydrolase superfamily lysophospholipase